MRELRCAMPSRDRANQRPAADVCTDRSCSGAAFASVRDSTDSYPRATDRHTLVDMTDEAARERAIQILVRSLYRDLKAQGFDDKHIVAVAIELLGKVTDELATERLPQRARVA
jgi:hypothetical protein